MWGLPERTMLQNPVFLPPAEYPLFTATDINTDSSIVGSLCVNGQVRCPCPEEQGIPRGNLGEAGGRGLWSIEGLSGAVAAHPGLAL